jgi:hypothetical protein
MTTYLEQITALGEADGLAHTGWDYPETYRETEIQAYCKGYDRGYWFREYKLGYKAGVNDMDISLQEPWNHSEAFMLGYKEGSKRV